VGGHAGHPAPTTGALILGSALLIALWTGACSRRPRHKEWSHEAQHPRARRATAAQSLDQLTAKEERVLQRIAERAHISRDVLAEHEGKLTFGQRLADRVAAFGGSWPFIILFLCIMLVWISLNASS